MHPSWFQSTDGSAALATAAGATVVQFQFNGTWPKKKNWALANLPFRHEWVLILDADEVLRVATDRLDRFVLEARRAARGSRRIAHAHRNRANAATSDPKASAGASSRKRCIGSCRRSSFSTGGC